MIRKNLYLNLLLILPFFSCEKAESTYENQSKSCILKLYSASKYNLTYPVFLKKDKKEQGVFEFRENTLVLTRKVKNKLPNVDISYTCSEDDPKSVTINFVNSNKKKIDARFKINDSSDFFESKSGEITLSYEELNSRQILRENERIKEFTFLYNGKEYIQNMDYYNDLRKPNELDFKLNEFMDEEYAVLDRKYKIRNDSILINDLDMKAIGRKNKYLIKK